MLALYQIEMVDVVMVVKDKFSYNAMAHDSEKMAVATASSDKERGYGLPGDTINTVGRM